MDQANYILNTKYRLVDRKDVIRENLPDNPYTSKILEGELFILQDHRTWHLITPVMKEFLDSFTTANSFPNVLRSMAKAANCKEHQIEPTVKSFFNKMIERKILINASEASQSQNHVWQDALELNKKFHAYIILDLIYSKLEIEIYKVKHEGSGKYYVIKALNLKNTFGQENKERLLKLFTQEVDFLRALQAHENLCKLIEFSEEKDLAFAVLEYVDGSGLRKFMKSEQPKINQRIDIIRQILASISWVHKKGITHGDIHVSNFLVKSPGTIKLIDFNLSNRSVLEDDEIIRTGGVYQYIPPEKVPHTSFKTVKERADFQSEVYQLGVVMYFVLYEKMPFNAFVWKDLIKKILNDALVFEHISSNNEPIPTSLLRIVRKTLSKDPNKRYKSACHLYRAFQKRVLDY